MTKFSPRIVSYAVLHFVNVLVLFVGIIAVFPLYSVANGWAFVLSVVLLVCGAGGMYAYIEAYSLAKRKAARRDQAILRPCFTSPDWLIAEPTDAPDIFSSSSSN